MSGRVYRCYDTAGTLLYVGHTMNRVKERMAGHRRKAAWYHEVSTVQIDEYPTWEQANRAEEALIMALAPKYNKLGNPGYGRRADVEKLAHEQSVEAAS